MTWLVFRIKHILSNIKRSIYNYYERYYWWLYQWFIFYSRPWTALSDYVKERVGKLLYVCVVYVYIVRNGWITLRNYVILIHLIRLLTKLICLQTVDSRFDPMIFWKHAQNIPQNTSLHNCCFVDLYTINRQHRTKPFMLSTAISYVKRSHHITPI